MSNKFKTGLAVFLATLGILGATSNADLSGRKVNPTGNNPQHYAIPTLTNIVENTSDTPQKMSIGNLQDSFRIAYDFRQSGIDFANTNKYFINFSDNNGDCYGVGRCSTNGTGFLDFYVNGQALNNSSRTLPSGSPMHATVCDSNNVYGLEKELSYNAQAGVNKNFTYTNSVLGKIIGSTDNLQIKTMREDSFNWQGFDGVNYNILSTEDLSKSWSTNGSLNCTKNGDCSYTFNPTNNIQFFRVQANIQE